MWKFFLLTIVLTSCVEQIEAPAVGVRDTSAMEEKLDYDTNIVTFNNKYEHEEVIDTLIQHNFWDSVVHPILNEKYDRVLATVKTTPEGDWSYMLNLKKTPQQLTLSDFTSNYRKLFTKDFLAILSKQTYRDIALDRFKDTLYCTFEVGRTDGEFESSVRFIYTEVDGKYSLKYIVGAGGDFYGSHTE